MPGFAGFHTPTTPLAYRRKGDTSYGDTLSPQTDGQRAAYWPALAGLYFNFWRITMMNTVHTGQIAHLGLQSWLAALHLAEEQSWLSTPRPVANVAIGARRHSVYNAVQVKVVVRAHARRTEIHFVMG
jgi:hypothetical protein